MLVLSNEEIARLLTIEECMAALEPMYRDVAEERALFSPRVDNIAPNSHPEGYYAFKHMGGTWPREKIQALRINSDVVTHPLVGGKPRRVKQPLAPGGRWVGLVLLFSTETGALLAMFPDGVMQRLRVGATSGLGLKHLARPDAERLALIGSGWQAGTQLAAALAVRRLREVRVWSPRRENREAFVAHWRAKGVDIRASETPDACVGGADVIAAATSSMVRVLEPRWLRPGLHASCIKTQEVDAEVLNRCDRVVFSNRRQAKHYDNVMKDTPNVKSESARGARPIRAEARTKPLSAVAKGRRWLDEIISGKVEGIEAIAAREGVSERSARMGLSLAFLAPDIIQAAVDGTLPRGLGLSRLMDMPPSWADQRRALGFAPNR